MPGGSQSVEGLLFIIGPTQLPRRMKTPCQLTAPPLTVPCSPAGFARKRGTRDITSAFSTLPWLSDYGTTKS